MSQVAVSSLEHLIQAARLRFEIEPGFVDQLNFSWDVKSQEYFDPHTQSFWVGFKAGYVRASAEYQKTFAGHVYITTAEYASLIGNQAFPE